ncbi:MAG: hypothetical protein H0V09_04810 [Gemmatimonadetes bacterium]|nr:hypothetical protein [Gemmatimonadota bacterium]
MSTTDDRKGARRAAVAFLLALVAVATVGCGATPFESQAGKTKLTSLPRSEAQP